MDHFISSGACPDEDAGRRDAGGMAPSRCCKQRLQGNGCRSAAPVHDPVRSGNLPRQIPSTRLGRIGKACQGDLSDPDPVRLSIGRQAIA